MPDDQGSCQMASRSQHGLLSIVWCIGWLSLVYDSPSSHPRISDTERDYITKAVGLQQTTGFISALPFLFYWFLMILGGYMADFIISRSILDRTATRKLFAVLGFVPSIICLVSVGYVGCDVTLVVVLLTLGLGTSAFCLCGSSICGFDIAPKYAGFLLAIINCFAGTAGFLVPLLIGTLTTNEGNVHGWRLVFWTTAGVSMFGLIVFSIFGTAEVQSWAQEPKTSEPNRNDCSNGKAKPDSSI
ncbi:sodium-dependent phosphate transport protein 3-like [Diadema antillarum]|uniref:sodium-dependent phosphate transport protein 3-like n=1 Tax=Diadema antillarum TaxID=105358 RepID=UPI003A89422B